MRKSGRPTYALVAASLLVLVALIGARVVDGNTVATQPTKFNPWPQANIGGTS